MVVHASNRGTWEAEPAWVTWEGFVSESKEKTKKNQTISETYKKNLIEGLKVGVINLESTIYTF